MIGLPIVPHYRAEIAGRALERAARLADDLRFERPRLRLGGSLGSLVQRGEIDGRPALHLDDFSGISIPTHFFEHLEHLEDRARLRAVDGDVVVSSRDPTPGYEAYCDRLLGLGGVRWVRARPGSPRRSLALACWADPETRAELTRLIEERGIGYLHPHMGSFAAWALASLLSRSSGRPLTVLAPPPALTAAVNDKLWFSDVVARLLGPEWVPRTEKASNFSTVSHLVRELARESHRIVVKLPDSAGGGGNLVLDSEPLRALSLGALRSRLKQVLRPLEWDGRRDLLVGSWESDVIASPSVQLWIPPEACGKPIIEGVFEQILEGSEGFFVGNRPAALEPVVERRIVDTSALLAILFQQLGYVGRCSFDLLLVGDDPACCRPEFIECNGRWGGTSLPMTLMNRLFGDWAGRDYCCLDHKFPTGDRPSFHSVVDRLGGELYDRRTGSGRIALFNAAGLAHGEIGVVGIHGGCRETRELLAARLGERAKTEGARPVAVLS